jgi:hypothetical protein
MRRAAFSVLILLALGGCRQIATYRCNDEPAEACLACCQEEGYEISGFSRKTGCECYGDGDVILKNPR